MTKLFWAIALPLFILLQWAIAPPLAQAETWVMVAQSGETQESQYVDADSIEITGSTVRLKSYWGMLDDPRSITHAVTEYNCPQQTYRDVVVNGAPTQDEWKAVGDDPLNHAAMEYGCKSANNLRSK